MKFTIPTLTAAAIMATSPTHAWVCGPGGFYGAVTPYATVTPSQILRQKEMIRRRQREIFKSRVNEFKDSHPRYEIVDNEEKYQVALDVPGVLMQDIDITVEDDGAVLKIAGMRKALEESTSTFVSKFSQRFSLDPTVVDVDKFSATLQNGVLIVTAPKELQRIQETMRKIPIQEIEDVVTAPEQTVEEQTKNGEKDQGGEVSSTDPSADDSNSQEHKDTNPGETSED